jgi:ABC-type transport system substrate-binding protein/class 3 adenylate cyclase/streptogramin lyase
MADRPTGTVTFLFTDIEGSTRLLGQLRERYGDVLSTHARLLRAAFEQFEGHEIDTQGDAFFVAFARARDAVAAAVAAQRALAAEPWPDGVSVRVRMGLHTGEPLVGGERYVGMGVHRGARIAAAGAGGQVLLSNTTRELVEDELPDDVHLRDLGEHELKDLKRPEHIFQLEIEGLPSEFPALRTAESSAFEGREDELTEAAHGVIRRHFTRRRTLLAVGAVAAIAAVALALVFALGGSAQKAVAANSVVALNQSGSVAKAVPVGTRPVALVAGVGSLWVANLDDKSITRVDPTSERPVRSISLPGSPTALAATEHAVWVGAGARGLSKIDPAYDQVTATRRIGQPTPLAEDDTVPRPALSAFGSLWVVSTDGYITRLDPDSGRETGSTDVGNDPSAIAAGAGSVWVANSSDGTITRIDPTTLLTTPIPVGHGPAAIAVNDAGVWVANAGDNTLVRVDPGTNAVASTTQVGDGPTAVLATPSELWVANGRDGTVMQLDPQSGHVKRTIHLGGTPDALASAGGKVWVAVAAPPPPEPTGGDVLRLTAQNGPSPLDPALTQSSELPYLTCANLVTYPDKPAPAGSHIVPEVAESIPTPTAGGRVYTFRIRPGFRFSPPSNEEVTAATFKSTIERVMDPRLQAQNASLFSGIVGYDAYAAGKTQGLAGIVARGRTLRITLSKPDGAFLGNLAIGACAVPGDTPAPKGGLNDIPSAGPYYIASYTPRQQLVLRRNPNYHGDRPRRFRRIVVTIGVDPARALREIEAGTADYASGGLPRDAAPRLVAKYGPGSPAAKAGHQQYFINIALGARWLHMNTSRPLFSNARLRRAVNYALDRPALVAQGRKYTEANPFNAGEPTSNYLTPGVAGATDRHVYPVDGPDLPMARKLAGNVHATAIMYTPNVGPWLQEAQIVRRDLKPIGIDVEVKEFPINAFFGRIGRRGEPFDLAVSGWGFGGTDPAQVFGTFDMPIGPAGNGNFSYFRNAALNRELAAAANLSGPSRYRAYRKIESDVERKYAPAAPFATDASRDFFSARIGCQVYQPVWGIDVGALCLRGAASR